MASNSTRLEIVQRAVKLSGRSAELYGEAKAWLNDLLGDLADKNRYKELLKVFDGTLTLQGGQSTVAFPSDMGSGIESILLNNEGQPLVELEFDDFVAANGFRPASMRSTRPTAYYFDKEARLIRFNATADQAYSLSGAYYKKPLPYATDATDDNTKIWYSNDAVIVQGLIQIVYQFTGDQREFLQEQKFLRMDGEYRRGTAPLNGGVTRIRLSSKFRSK